MTTDHDRLRRLVLVLEDLEGGELAMASAHVAQCPACAGLRASVIAAETRMRTVPGLSTAPDPLAALGAEEQAAAAASRAALLAGSDGGARAPRWPRLLPMALAAAAALALLFPALAARGPIRELQLGSPLVLRGGDAATAGRGVSFRPSRAGYPVLVHVDAGGTVRLLYPTGGDAGRPVAAGVAVLLPRPEHGDAWRSGLTPGCGTYLLALATERPPTTAQLAALAALTTAGEPGPAVREAARRLRELAGAVERLDDEGCH